MVSKRSFTREFKLTLCRDLEDGKITQGQACREHALSGTLVRNWLSQFRAKGEQAFSGDAWRASTLEPESRVRELEASLGRAHLEIEFLREVLAKKSSPPRSGSK